MRKRILIVLAVMLLLGLGASAGLADGSACRFKGLVSSTYWDTGTSGDPGGPVGLPVSAWRVEGTIVSTHWGKGTMTEVGWSDHPNGWWGREPVIYCAPLVPGATFTFVAANGDELYGSLEGSFCQNLEAGFGWGTFHGPFTGGTGRFEGARGTVVKEWVGYEAVIYSSWDGLIEYDDCDEYCYDCVSADLPDAAEAAPWGYIEGLVFDDVNFNGMIDPGEGGIHDVGVRISAGGWSAFTTTDWDGTFGFTALNTGRYTLEVILPDTYLPTTPATIQRDITVGGQPMPVMGADFGLTALAELAAGGPRTVKGAVQFTMEVIPPLDGSDPTAQSWTLFDVRELSGGPQASGLYRWIAHNQYWGWIQWDVQCDCVAFGSDDSGPITVFAGKITREDYQVPLPEGFGPFVGTYSVIWVRDGGTPGSKGDRFGWYWGDLGPAHSSHPGCDPKTLPDTLGHLPVQAGDLFIRSSD